MKKLFFFLLTICFLTVFSQEQPDYTGPTYHIECSDDTMAVYLNTGAGYSFYRIGDMGFVLHFGLKVEETFYIGKRRLQIIPIQ